jgi:hypothetical protein
MHLSKQNIKGTVSGDLGIFSIFLLLSYSSKQFYNRKSDCGAKYLAAAGTGTKIPINRL